MTNHTPEATPHSVDRGITILLTVSQMVERHPALTVGGLRHLLFHLGHELEDAGIVVRFGRKILIDEPRYIDWLRSGSARNIQAKVQRHANRPRAKGAV